ncbi:hypothetical protein DL93DRAFT_2162912 [Clavulina sp. PMI_390]|nr:hypothetical protein DL93DRAFT_2162912 [Clavulina sp. PMI_390]
MALRPRSSSRSDAGDPDYNSQSTLYQGSSPRDSNDDSPHPPTHDEAGTNGPPSIPDSPASTPAHLSSQYASLANLSTSAHQVESDAAADPLDDDPQSPQTLVNNDSPPCSQTPVSERSSSQDSYMSDMSLASDSAAATDEIERNNLDDYAEPGAGDLIVDGNWPSPPSVQDEDEEEEEEEVVELIDEDYDSDDEEYSAAEDQMEENGDEDDTSSTFSFRTATSCTMHDLTEVNDASDTDRPLRDEFGSDAGSDSESESNTDIHPSLEHNHMVESDSDGSQSDSEEE